MVFQESFNGVWSKKRVSRKFTSCFKEVLRLFTESLKVVSLKFKDIFKEAWTIAQLSHSLLSNSNQSLKPWSWLCFPPITTRRRTRTTPTKIFQKEVSYGSEIWHRDLINQGSKDICPCDIHLDNNCLDDK